MAKRQGRTFNSWRNMMSRCYGQTDRAYHRYGGRGIQVWGPWHDYDRFYADLGERPPGLTIDRYPDNNGHYEPGNVRWATPTQQSRNQRSNIPITYNGETKIIAEWAESADIDYRTLQRRLRELGWDMNRALVEPAQDHSIPLTITHADKTQTIKQWSVELNIPIRTIYERIYRGYNAAGILSTAGPRIIIINDVEHSIKEAAVITGISWRTLHRRLAAGLHDDLLLGPVRKVSLKYKRPL